MAICKAAIGSRNHSPTYDDTKIQGRVSKFHRCLTHRHHWIFCVNNGSRTIHTEFDNFFEAERECVLS